MVLTQTRWNWERAYAVASTILGADYTQFINKTLMRDSFIVSNMSQIIKNNMLDIYCLNSVQHVPALFIGNENSKQLQISWGDGYR